MELILNRRVAAGVRLAQDESGGFALDVEHGRIYQLNRVGAFVIQALVEGSTPDDLLARMTECFQISRLQVEQDVADFLLETDEAGLTQRCASQSGPQT